uniref:Uncharacterized protein n=1 Tax=Vespula pensylvanica TaxID=30213 RepID=A0A834U548_VESPE|nr:hypothetical protein H0235_011426 [Vespula pensylvanica]
MNVTHTMNEPDPCLPLILPPRYRLRDLILGDYAFNDDGERLHECKIFLEDITIFEAEILSVLIYRDIYLALIYRRLLTTRQIFEYKRGDEFREQSR